MFHIKWGELFPTKLSVFIFISYMTLFVNQGVLVTASQNSTGSYSYDTTLVVLLTEVCKLFTSAALYCTSNTVVSMIKAICANLVLLSLYLISSLLYCFYNNLAFINLSLFDPTTYYLLLQFRVVITALLFQIIFKKHLNKKQWISLLLLTVGCMIKHIDYGVTEEANHGLTEKINYGLTEKSKHGVMDIWAQMFSFGAMLIVIQSFCSSLAGVYNEYLLKNNGIDVDIYIQNIFMYFDSIICNVILILLQGKSLETYNMAALKSVFSTRVLVVIINSTLIGIVTSFFLKTMNSILKTFASALELIFTAIVCYIIFGIPISMFTVISIFVVSLAVIIYTQSPVVNQPKYRSNYDEQPLMEGPEDV